MPTEVLEAVRSRQIPLPVIVITAHDEFGTAERVRALGASAYLKKPVDQDDLFSAIAEVMPPGMATRNLGARPAPRNREN